MIKSDYLTSEACYNCLQNFYCDAFALQTKSVQINQTHPDERHFYGINKFTQQKHLMPVDDQKTARTANQVLYTETSVYFSHVSDDAMTLFPKEETIASLLELGRSEDISRMMTILITVTAVSEQEVTLRRLKDSNLHCILNISRKEAGDDVAKPLVPVQSPLDELLLECPY